MRLFHELSIYFLNILKILCFFKFNKKSKDLQIESKKKNNTKKTYSFMKKYDKINIRYNKKFNKVYNYEIIYKIPDSKFLDDSEPIVF
jgi:hypothetical protein